MSLVTRVRMGENGCLVRPVCPMFCLVRTDSLSDRWYAAEVKSDSPISWLIRFFDYSVLSVVSLFRGVVGMSKKAFFSTLILVLQLCPRDRKA